MTIKKPTNPKMLKMWQAYQDAKAEEATRRQKYFFDRHLELLKQGNEQEAIELFNRIKW